MLTLMMVMAGMLTILMMLILIRIDVDAFDADEDQ